MHPAMEVVYKPLAHRWPYIADAIRNEAGSFFEDGYYSRVHMGGYVEKGWGVLYFVPRSRLPVLGHAGAGRTREYGCMRRRRHLQ